jgi:hypothetical protein
MFSGSVEVSSFRSARTLSIFEAHAIICSNWQLCENVDAGTTWGSSGRSGTG